MRIDRRPSLAPASLPRNSLREQLESDLGMLSGQRPLPGAGGTLTDRASPENRAKVREFLQQRLRQLGFTPQVQAYSPTGQNVFAVLPSTTPSPDYVVVGAHFDTVRCAGANDNGTGVAGVLAIARQLAQQPQRSKNLVVALFDEEERGLLGSRAFAKLAKENGWRAELHGLDMLGWDQDGDRAIELDRPSNAAIVPLYERAAKKLGMNVQFPVTRAGGSDHVSFQNAGLSAVCLSEEWSGKDTTPYYHSAKDTFATVNFGYLESSSRLIAQALQDLIGSPARLGDPDPHLAPLPYEPRRRPSR